MTPSSHDQTQSSPATDSILRKIESRPKADMPLEFNYHLLRYALNDFSKNISQLNADQYDKIYPKALKSYRLESQVISATEAESVEISPQQLDQAIQTLSSRYASEQEFRKDLEENFIDLSTLRNALHRELVFDGIMQRITSQIPEVTAVDIELFYEMHRSRFETPEKRQASHILITINPDFPENTRIAALEKLTGIAEKLTGVAKQFAEMAKRYSECPTAMEGGKLGDVMRGQLYPELDAALFNMNKNQLSSIIETEIGFHILYCHNIHPRKTIPLSQVREKIKQTLQSRYLHAAQKAWLEKLNQ